MGVGGGCNSVGLLRQYYVCACDAMAKSRWARRAIMGGRRSWSYCVCERRQLEALIVI